MSGSGEPAMDSSMDEPESTDNPQEESDEKPSVFLPKDCLPEGKKYQPGDKIELTVEDVDPETGEVQACLYNEEGNQKDSGKGAGYLESFDKQFPPDQG